ncbi:MAG: hypothetical protein DRP97_04595 [Candidatus Latescibacterota bacterium]|nr:MAG: hypothetical protein DRP97_04595 [Candidatus Latescibacterota bacterium]
MNQNFDRLNPWRKGDRSFLPFRTIRRELLDPLIVGLDRPWITVLIGSRQVGKTFLMKLMIQHQLENQNVPSQNIFYFDLDYFEFWELLEDPSRFLDFLEIYGGQEGTRYVYLDEVQRLKNAGLILKRLHDLHLDLKLIVSGSSSLEIKSQVKETLAGRKRVYEVYPLSFPEYYRFKTGEVLDGVPTLLKYEKNRVEKHLDAYLNFGGYPGVALEDDPEEKKALLREIYDAYVRRDISDFMQVEDIQAFNKLVVLSASRVGTLMNVEEISRTLRIPRNTTLRYLDILEQTFIIHRLPPFFENRKKELVKMPKLYMLDNGLRNVSLNYFQEITFRPDRGALAENFVFSQFARKFGVPNLSFWRTTGKSEIDFIRQDGVKLTPVEVKYRSFKGKTVPKVFRPFIENYGDRIERFVVLTKDFYEETRISGKKVLFQPLWAC